MAYGNPLENPWYYLQNFEFALNWVAERYADLLDEATLAFIASFLSTPRNSRALLVRMFMRKGELFRVDRLRYDEIGDTLGALTPLLQQHWVEDDPPIGIDDLFRLYTRDELDRSFAGIYAELGVTRATKAAQHAALSEVFPHALCLHDWCQGRPVNAVSSMSATCVEQDATNANIDTDLSCVAVEFNGSTPSSLPGPVLQLNCRRTADRLRLMFFGNLRQDWTEFVLADLGVYQYEAVPFPTSARAFHRMEDIDLYMELHDCAIVLADASDADVVKGIEAQLTTKRVENEWLRARASKLWYAIGQWHERQQDWTNAHAAYIYSERHGARRRRVRVLERAGHHTEALELAQAALAAPESEEERQALQRSLPRLLRACGHPRATAAKRAACLNRMELALDLSSGCVEECVRVALHVPQAPAFYVENTLLNSLLGLLCWDAIFAPIPGAFFHPFQSGPADLYRPGFHDRRADMLEDCLRQLDSSQYRDTIWDRYRAKAGTMTPFVAWGAVSEELLELALVCIPAQHLKAFFRRMLQDLRANCSGLPDLIQFFPDRASYRMVEVKGPGDKVQDNQQRWLDYCEHHDIPVKVCFVRHQPS